MKASYLLPSVGFVLMLLITSCRETTVEPGPIDQSIDPSTLMWYDRPAEKWEDALPIGNGRLGAMIFGKYGEEQIQLNEETYWSGGPYSTVVKGGYQKLPEIQQAIFNGEPLKAHKLFGRYLMGYPVEQQKYQALANLHLSFPGQDTALQYRRSLDLNTGIASVTYVDDSITYRRELIASVPDQTIAIRLTADKPGSISLDAQLRGVRNSAHSNYATDYFRMDALGDNQLILTGKSADYLGVEGRLKYDARIVALPEGGSISADDNKLIIRNADAVTLYFVAATNFVNYKDVSADQHGRVESYLQHLEGRSFEAVKTDAVSDYQPLFKRVKLSLPETPASFLPTNERLTSISSEPDPQLATLCYNFGRYLLIASSRPGTQPANLQGIWNKDMNPSWDAKYTTNINTEMNYWPVETGNLPELAEPLITMVKELTDQGAQVAKEHYGARGWVFHQNTDIWRVAAPMDGPTWGTFTVGGAWLVTHLYEHYLFTQDMDYLREVYPVIKGAVEFFMDFLVEHPNGRWLVTNPSNSPENPPKGAGYEYFYDEVTGMYYFTTIVAGATMDMQILKDLFSYYISASEILDIDREFAGEVALARKRLPPSQVGKDGMLQEWTEDLGQLEAQHRHFSHLYGLYPGNVVSARRTPELIDPVKQVLEQRGDGGTGFSRGWKMALWARLYDGNRANRIFKGYLQEQCYPSLFAKCFTPLQVDGSLGVTAGITEMLIQSHEGMIELLPALPDEWADGAFGGVRARGGFELSFAWQNKELTSVEVLSKSGKTCRMLLGKAVRVVSNGKEIDFTQGSDGVIEFATATGNTYLIEPIENAASDWKVQFADPGTGNWQDNWFLDGPLAKVINTEKGMDFSAGPVNKDDAHHAVLWTKASFKGDLKIEYNYTRTDSQLINVNILYIQASGIGTAPFVQDITQWNDYRTIPTMSKYWRNMNLLHISYAAFPTVNEDPDNDYIRVRRYPATENVEFSETEVPPAFERTGLFLPNVTYKMTWIKTGGELLLKVEGDGKSQEYAWDLSAFPPITEGRIGLRHMYTRSARYSDFKVSVK